MDTVQNGKGSKWRNTDFKSYHKNYDQINWSKEKSANQAASNSFDDRRKATNELGILAGTESGFNNN
jgi:hypothetical protein